MTEEVVEQNKWIVGSSRFFILLGIFSILLFVGTFIAALLVSILFGTSFIESQEVMQSISINSPKANRYALLIFQGIIAFIGFVGSAFIFISLVEQKKIYHLQANAKFSIQSLFLISILVIISQPFIGWIAYWNINMDFPSFMAGFERWAQESEDKLRALTLFLTDFQSFGEYFTALIVVALVAAVGEELLFRVVLQRNLNIMFNTHVSIWITAVLFSALHAQFYGFFPRMILGALFGYIYIWSRNLWMPILAHFVNNALGLTLVYLYKIKVLDYDATNEDSVPFTFALVSLTLSLGIIFYLQKHFTSYKNSNLKEDI